MKHSREFLCLALPPFAGAFVVCHWNVVDPSVLKTSDSRIVLLEKTEEQLERRLPSFEHFLLASMSSFTPEHARFQRCTRLLLQLCYARRQLKVPAKREEPSKAQTLFQEFA
jgi:hypothetical protein